MKLKEHARRRRQLMRMMGPDSIAVLPAAPVRIRNRDVAYPYRQDSDFLYLSGFPEPEAVLVLIPKRQQGEYILFCRERDPKREAWDGPIIGQQGATEYYDADDAFPVTDMDDILPGLLEGRERVYYTMGQYESFDQRMMAWLKRIRGQGRGDTRAPEEIVSLEHLLHEMRLIKTRAELGVMRKAARLSARAHNQAMQVCRPGLTEYQIEAELLRTFRAGNATPAYQSIVGAGANACVLHYVRNQSTLEDGDLLLIDAGAELDCYASDVTRTIPVSGRYTPPQRAIYDVVLEAQQAAIEQVRPGKHWNDPHDAAVKVITKGLVSLGLLKGRPAKLIKDGAYKRFFMHRTGHWIGMDVHDVGDYKVDGHWRELEAGMAMTVEPGIYIAPGVKDVAGKWRGIGVRIEDDVAVTKDGCKVLSDKAPKRPEDIEAVMK